ELGAALRGTLACELENASRGTGAEELEENASRRTGAEELEEAASSRTGTDELENASRRTTESAGCGTRASVRPVPMDLTDSAAVASLGKLLNEEDADVVLLVNAAGFGKFQAVSDVPQQMADSMLALNCKALMDMCYTVIPFMNNGAKILNIASVAAFQPVPYVTEYAATKAFVLSFSRGLWKELHHKGITVTALCPYWTRTEFFDVANNNDSKDMVKYFNAMYEPEDVVRRGWRDLMKGRDISTFGFIARAQIVLVKLLPHRLVMRIWCHQQKIKG
ncbi:MAG: SDR family NAD(P)-dependent oxidoreductase, partial [Bacteroidales bacterium]|nr:SDR family NAD(P)-dependent oxidoreductase [Candidatus Equibacterium intestinale]